MFCKNCGIQINDNTRFCPSCGAASNTPPSAALRVGYSPVINTQEFISCMNKHRKQGRQVIIGTAILLPFIGALAGAIIGEGSTVGIIDVSTNPTKSYKYHSTS